MIPGLGSQVAFLLEGEMSCLIEDAWVLGAVDANYS